MSVQADKSPLLTLAYEYARTVTRDRSEAMDFAEAVVAKYGEVNEYINLREEFRIFREGDRRMTREAIAGLREEDRAQAELESYGMSRGSAADLTDFDKAERDMDLMERYDDGHPQPNPWVR